MWKFSFFYSLPFWAGMIIVALTYRAFKDRPRAKKWFLAFASSLMVLSIPEMSIIKLLAVLGLSVLTYLFGYILNRGAIFASMTVRKLLAGLGIGFVLVFLAFFKYHFFQALFIVSPGTGSTAVAHHVFLIGVSYFSFKMISFIVESFRKKNENLSLINYLNYTIFFVPFVSGPINRYNHFSSQLGGETGATQVIQWRDGLERIVHGLFKKLVLAQLLFPHILGSLGKPVGELSLPDLILGLYAYALYFYFDFAGYSDLAVGCARLLGLSLPENFNNPFLKRNIRELWANWHMSLTSWLVDYIYWPIVRKLRNNSFFRPRPVFLSNLGMIITFVVCGMWHGEAFHFILWGAYHGLGIAVLTIYQREKRKIKIDALQRYFRSKLSLAAGTFLTFHFFTLGLSLFVLDIRDLQGIIRRFFLW